MTQSAVLKLSLAIGVLSAAACSTAIAPSASAPVASTSSSATISTAAPNPDPRVGLKAGLFNAGEASWNLQVLSQTPPSAKFAGITNSDLAFTGNYAIQGSYNGYQV